MSRSGGESRIGRLWRVGYVVVLFDDYASPLPLIMHSPDRGCLAATCNTLIKIDIRRGYRLRRDRRCGSCANGFRGWLLGEG